MLHFPTDAEKCLAEWAGIHHKTIPLAAVAKRYDAFRDDDGTTIIWVFNDDTTIRINGRGANYTAVTELP